MSLPAIAAGAAAQHYGLRTTAHAYTIATALLAAAALAALTCRGAAQPTPHTTTFRNGTQRTRS